MRFKLPVPVLVLGGLAFAGGVMRRVEAPVWAAMRAEQPTVPPSALGAAAEQGLAIGVLGGFRAVAADFAWLRVYENWDRRDLPATEALLRFVTTLDPRPLYFWLNGARIIAYDMTAWRIVAAGGYEAVPMEERRRIGVQQARLALGRIEEAMASHPASADLWIERANIELNGLNDVTAAAASYRRAWEQPNAPYYAARLHGELLRRLGRKTEALAWLEQIYPNLPPHEEAAGAALVLARIRDLETELGVPTSAAFHAGP